MSRPEGRRGGRGAPTAGGWVILAGLFFLILGCSTRSASIPAPPTPTSAPQPPTPTVPTAEQPPESRDGRAPADRPASDPAPSNEESAPGSTAGPATRDVRDGVEPREAQTPPGAIPGGTASTTEEEVENLDRELSSSLSEFDGMLVKEQELLDERRDAAGGQSLGGGMGATGEEVSGGQQTGNEQPEYAESDTSGGSPDRPAGEPEASEPGESAGAEDVELESGRVPPDVGDGSDDDIVARQLREAAEKEDDPGLREKLWDEYRAYKNGTKKD